MKFIKYFTVLSLLIISVLYSQPNIIADSHNPGESVEFEDDGSHDRELFVDLDPDEIRLEAELKNGTNQDKFRVEMKLDSAYPDDNKSGEVEIRFKYQK